MTYPFGVHHMLVQIYEVATADEAGALGHLGVDHIGVLVGDGTFPREQSIEAAKAIFSAMPPSSKGSALCLSSNVDFIKDVVSKLRPPILHLGASTDLVNYLEVKKIKTDFPGLIVMRSIPVVDERSIDAAKAYDGIADMLLLDSHKPGDTQIGALGVTHDWELDRAIVHGVSIPVIIAGGLGPDNVSDAIRAIRPAGVDSKTKTDMNDGSHRKDLEKVRMFVERARNT